MSSVAWEWEEQVKVLRIFRHHSGNFHHVLKESVLSFLFRKKENTFPVAWE